MLVAGVVLVAMIAGAVRLVAVAVVVTLVLLLVVALLGVYAKVTLLLIAAVAMILDANRLHITVIVLIAIAIAVVMIVVHIVAAMASMVGLVAVRSIEVEERVVMVNRVDAEVPTVTIAVDRTEQILAIHELLILAIVQDVTEIVVAVVQDAVVMIDGITITKYYVVHDTVYAIDIIEVDLVNVIILIWSEVELVGHAVAQEAGVITYLAH